ncbi:MAG: Methyltransferase protein [Firmicutes bacterium]|nr:Methyltransferase protein [Bacillota bacterium]
MSERQTSRFFRCNDPRLNKIFYDLPESWWSRPYEYAWASSLVSQDDVVLDAACGIGHPFKYYLCDLCRQVYACDVDERILSNEEILADIFNVFGPQGLNFPLQYLEKPVLSQQDITVTTFPDEMFDRIVCISVLEHLSENDLRKALLEFKRILKKDGLIIITIDYPYLGLDIFNCALGDSGLAYADQANFEITGDVLHTALFPEFPEGLYSFRALLRKC